MRRILIIIIAFVAIGTLPSPVHAYMTPEEIFDVPVEAQTSEAPPTPEEESARTEIQSRIFYRNGETKSVAPETEKPSTVPQPTVDPTMELPVTDPALQLPVTPPEPTEPNPLPESELLMQTATQIPNTAPPEAPEDSSSMTLMISGAIIGFILLGGILMLALRFARRFRSTLSKEAIAPPPIAASDMESSSRRLETALGVKGPPVS